MHSVNSILRLQRLVPGLLKYALAQRDRDWVQRRSTGPDHETERFLVPTSQAHDEAKAQRSIVLEGRSEIARAERKRPMTMPKSR
jgi:hypothetical protein